MAAAYKDKLSAFTGVISRTLGGERGVLTDRAIVRVVGALPGFRYTKSIKDFKIKSIELLLNTAMDAKKRQITGKPIDPTLRTQLEEALDAIEGKANSGTAEELLKKRGRR